MEIDTHFDLFGVSTAQREEDIRLTSHDIYRAVLRLGGTQNHHQIRAAAIRDFGDSLPRVAVKIDQGAMGREIDTVILDADQALVLVGSLGGKAGVEIRNKMVEHIKALKAKIREQATQLKSVGPLVSKIEYAYATGQLPSLAHYLFMKCTDNPTPKQVFDMMSPIYGQAMLMKARMPKTVDGHHGGGRHLLAQHIAKEVEAIGLELPPPVTLVPSAAPATLANGVSLH